MSVSEPGPVQNLTLRIVGNHPDGGRIYLAEIDTDPVTWAYVRGPMNQGMALAAMVEQAQKITWRSGPLEPPPVPRPINGRVLDVNSAAHPELEAE